eukprot:4911446-Pyramimonas_sp.AAC.1
MMCPLEATGDFQAGLRGLHSLAECQRWSLRLYQLENTRRVIGSVNPHVVPAISMAPAELEAFWPPP